MKEICHRKKSICIQIVKLLAIFQFTGGCDWKPGYYYKEIRLTSITSADERENSIVNVEVIWQNNYVFHIAKP